jgi:hypothetical protein
MTDARIRVDQITLRIGGISAGVAEAAIDGLEEELRRRLGELAVSAVAAGTVARIEIDSRLAMGVAGAAALRSAIVAGLIDGLVDRAAQLHDVAEGF